jgi:hypothetical protein
VDDWYWAAPSDEPAGDRFIIENGKAALWPRVRGDKQDGLRVDQDG